jgi:DNA-binding CsgD family transcriptional regulator
MTQREPFSEREKDVVDLLIQGKSNKQIALSLGVSNRTVEFHLSHVYAKLKVNSRTEAMVKLSKEHLREPTGTDLRETTVEKVRETPENDGKPIISTRRITMKKLLPYILAIVSISCIGLFVFLLVYRAGQNGNPQQQIGTVQGTSMPTKFVLMQASTQIDVVPISPNTPTPISLLKITPPATMIPHTYVGGLMTYDRERGEAVLFGGQQLWNCDLCDETWVWNAATWAKLEPNNRPQGRSGFGFAYDATRKVSVLFGGMAAKPDGGNIFLDDTWVWNGANWIKQAPYSTPGVHLSPLMVFDENRKKIILYGGTQPQGRAVIPMTDTWLWNGMTWEEQKTSINPGPAFFLAAGMAYDSSHQEVVLWNGSTWTWNGADWIKQTPSHSPSQMNGVVLGYDETNQQTILVGRKITTEPGQEITETWIWDGEDWTSVQEDFPIKGASGENMIYDSQHHALILFTLNGDKFIGKSRTALVWTGKTWMKLYEAPADPIGTRPTSNP